MESAPSGLIMTDGEGRIVLANREVERLFGYPREELLGRPVEMLVPEVSRRHHPGDRRAFMGKPSVRAMGTGRDLYGLRKDGHEVPVEIGLTPVATEEGMFVVASVVDISARRAAEEERRRLFAQLQEAQRTSVIGTVAGGVAHDLNNVLAAIIGYGELVRSRLSGAAAGPELDTLLTAATHGQRIVERVLQFGRRARPEPRLLDLGTTVRDAALLARALLPASIEIDVEVPPGRIQVMGDATSIHQVLMNLATNAAHAMHEGGTLRISLAAAYLRDTTSRSLPNLHEGHYALLVVQDAGTGMPPDVVANAFEPFYTTKAPGTGSGLGLSMVHQLVRELGGAVGLESAVGVGTVVRCYIPTAEPGTGTDTGIAPMPRGAGERLLLVEDEPSLLEIGVLRLTELGYDVVGAGDAVEAIAAVEREPAGFDLVVTDFTMPRVNGLQLAEHVHALRADLPIILLSGYVASLDPAQVAAAGIRRIVEKPPTLPDLAHVVREALDRPGS